VGEVEVMVEDVVVEDVVVEDVVVEDVVVDEVVVVDEAKTASAKVWVALPASFVAFRDNRGGAQVSFDNCFRTAILHSSPPESSQSWASSEFSRDMLERSTGQANQVAIG